MCPGIGDKGLIAQRSADWFVNWLEKGDRGTFVFIIILCSNYIKKVQVAGKH